MSTKERIGLFGGTFNPIHYAHLRVAQEIRECLSMDKIIFIPSFNPPLKTKALADPMDRLEMVKLAIEGNHYFEISDIEYLRPGLSYTANTVRQMQDLHKDAEIFLMLGMDAFIALDQWYKPEAIIETVNIVAVARPSVSYDALLMSRIVRPYLPPFEGMGHKTVTFLMASGKILTVLPVTQLDISASAIRELIKQGKSIKYLLPENVESFIISNGLYK